MNSLKRIFSNFDKAKLLGTFIFLAIFFAFIYLWVDPKVIYHAHGSSKPLPIAILGTENFISKPATPAFEVEYLAAVLHHFYYYSWAAAFIITVTAGLLCVLAGKIISALGYTSLQRLRFVPAILLAAIFGRFHYYLTDSLSLLAALVLLNIYIAIPFKSNLMRLTEAIVFTAAAYFAGIWALAVFVTTCLILEIINNRSWLFAIIYGLFAIAVVYLIDLIYFDWGLTDLIINRQFVFQAKDKNASILILNFVLFVPALGLICLIHNSLQKRKAHKKAHVKKQTSDIRLKFGNKNLQTAIMLIAACAFIFLTADVDTRRSLRISYFAREKMFEPLLTEAKKLPLSQSSILISHDIDRALFHTGKLLDEMFCYPQYVQALMLNFDDKRDPIEKILSYSRRADTVYELGYINQAEDAALDSLTIAGYHPASLKMLAKVNIIKKQPAAARVFLNELSKDFLHRKWALEYLKKMETDPLLSNDPEISKMRSFMPIKDILNQQANGGDLFQLNRNNKMALEYGIAYYLLNGQPEMAVQTINFLDLTGYPKDKIPRHIEEAILIHDLRTGKKTDLHGRTIRPETIALFQEFISLSSGYKPEDMSLAKEQLAEKFGNTFYYYLFFAVSGRAK